MIELTLPYPPSVNSYKNIGRLTKTKNGKLLQMRVNSPQTKQFYWNVWVKIHALMASQGVKAFGESMIYVEIDVYPPDKRKRDIDNVVKPILDSMQHAGLYDDDYQIARLLITKCSIIEQGQVIVRIFEL